MKTAQHHMQVLLIYSLHWNGQSLWLMPDLILVALLR